MARMKPLDARHKIYPLVEIQGVKLRLPQPERIPPIDFIGREEILDKALAAWMSMGSLKPLNFRLFGPPGVGKNAIVYRLAKILKKDLYILNGNEELDPEDVACSARITSSDSIEYVASPLFAAMLTGGIFFFDEIGKAPPAALNPLASVLDERRTLSSVLAGIHLEAHDEFLFCAALNDDEETGGRLPHFIEERLSPAIHVGIPSPAALKNILRSHMAAADERWIDIYMKKFRTEETSPRDAKNHIHFACAMAKRAAVCRPTDGEIRGFLKKASGNGKETDQPVPLAEAPSEPKKKTVPQETTDEIEHLLVLNRAGEGEVTH